jgi:hypothetical protein
MFVWLVGGSPRQSNPEREKGVTAKQIIILIKRTDEGGIFNSIQQENHKINKNNSP